MGTASIPETGALDAVSAVPTTIPSRKDTATNPDDLKDMIASLGSRQESNVSGIPPASPATMTRHEKVSENGTGDTLREKSIEKRESPLSDPLGTPSIWNSRFVIPIAAIFLAAIVTGATWYALSAPKRTQDQSENAPLEEPAQQNDPAVPENTVALSSEMPNYLILDTEAADSTPSGITGLLDETEQQVKDANPAFPVEFIIRDANNHPIAFSRLAFLLGLDFPSDILSSFDEEFSLYYVVDKGEIRRALSIRVRPDNDVFGSIRSKETGMPTWFGSLLYGSSLSVPETAEFMDGTYGTLATRFANFTGTGSLSLDYAVLDDSLVIGTSKDSFRAALGNVIRIR